MSNDHPTPPDGTEQSGTEGAGAAASAPRCTRVISWPEEAPRRSFMGTTVAGFLTAVAALIPISAAVAVFLDPLRKRKSAAAGDLVLVTTLDALPDDGLPHEFPIIRERQDAWTHHPAQTIGTIFLRRTGETDVEAWTTICPHAGCKVAFLARKDEFFCPCHSSSFNLEGVQIQGVSPRPLDTLEVDQQRLAQGEVWVNYQRFRTGLAEKIAEA